MRRRSVAILGLLAALGSAQARAETPADQLARFEREAREEDPAFQGFSADRGEAFFRARHGGEWSCASCHTEEPTREGRHARTGASISPLAPAADPKRFTDTAKVDKWFRRNCKDVLGRQCTAAEKGDVLAWLAGLSTQEKTP